MLRNARLFPHSFSKSRMNIITSSLFHGSLLVSHVPIYLYEILVTVMNLWKTNEKVKNSELCALSSLLLADGHCTQFMLIALHV
jgi:hypothetical protein